MTYNNRMKMNNELERMWKEVVTKLKVQSRYWPAGMRKMTGKNSVRMFHKRPTTENESIECYRLS
jgi:hypothetical protein